MTRRPMILVWALFGLLWTAGVAAVPALADDEQAEVLYNSVTGTVSAADKHGIAVEYATTARGSLERYLPLAEKVRMTRFQSMTDLRSGDTVKVGYQQTYKVGAEGERIVLGTMVTDITLLKRAPVAAPMASKEEGEDNGS